MKNYKVNPEQLKEKTLQLIQQHNAEEKRPVKPINGYGDIDTSIGLFWALRNDDQRSTGQV
jgi:hypothetical protein